MNNIKYFLVVQLLFSLCLCEISNGQKEKLLNGFKEYYNSLPNQVYRSEEVSLLSTQQVDDSTYEIVASIRVAEINNFEANKLLKCTATIKDSDNDVTIINNNCEEAVEQKQSTDENQETTLEPLVEVSEPTLERKPVQLVNEVQADTAITSGEQFIAIPRDQPNAPCVGCASHVNPQAAGVSDLANLGVRHLDLHEPSVKHSLESVIGVERQVQVVNGVRYVLILSINFNHCTEVESENCASSKTCKITILVKPRVKLSNGGNYRAILANNCTEEWQYGDNGEVLPELSADNNQIKGNTSVDPSDTTAFDGDIQVKHNINVESQPNQERSLTEEDIKNIQEQIISKTQFQEITESSRQSTLSSDASDASKQHVFKIEAGNQNENAIPVTESEKTVQAININLDKKKAIDEMLDFFDFSGFKPKSEAEDVVPRVRRSYDYDLQVLSLAKDFHGIKNSLENARFMYEMAQAMVDHLNEMDLEVKNRVVKNVMKAGEETENLQRFVYIQARVTIPCDKVECELREVNTQICNGVIDCSNEKSPQMLNTFCYNDNKESEHGEGIREVSLDDPVLRRMAEEAVNKIESDSESQYAMKINKIASAITQVTSGTLTKFSIIVEHIKCNKSVPLPLRINCTVLEQLGSKICDVIVHERHWLKEKKISYTCTERPADMRISKSKIVSKNVTVDDPAIIGMLQEAIQYLESQSDKTNKQKIVNVKSISSQIIAGFLTKIEFVVGYTDCTDENYSRDQINKCELLKGEGYRSCRAQIWDRSWIMDGRQIEVSCDDASNTNEIDNTRKKRSIDSASDQEQQSSSKENDIDYKKLANESLYKFMQSSFSHQHYEVVKVDKAIVQDISRKLIKIDFSISPTDCLIQNDGILSSPKCDIVNPKNILHCHSKILQNNWINKKQYFVKCNIKYQQKKNTNVLKERNPSDSKYYQLAEESLAKYLHDTSNPHHIIVRVEKVTTQIVSGLLTKIDFIISPKNHSVSNNKTVRCHSEILEKRWTETKAFNVSCQMKKNEHLVKINTDNPKYMQIAVESLQKYIKDNPESNLVRVAFVDKVEQKGNTIKIKFIASHAEEGDGDTLCYAEVSDTKESKSDIEVKCHLIGIKIYRKDEITEDDPNYYKYVQLADESLRNYLQKINSSLYTLVSIESVTVQWDEGMKTIMNFTISPIDTEHSELIQGKQCIAEVLEQPELNKKNIDVKCELEKDLYRTKRRASITKVRRQLTLGGDQEQDPSNPKYKALAEESLQKYVVESGITQSLLVVARIEKVTSQVVSGILTCIDFLVSGSPDSETIKCHSKVWDRPWLNSKEINVSCQNDSHLRGKRQLLGGPKDEDPTEPRYKALARESLRKYAIDSGITKPLEVAHVEKVTTQAVSGTVTRIDFLVSGSPDSEIMKCHSEVWDRPWLKRKSISITVSCENDGKRGKRHLIQQLVGGPKDQDPTEPQYKALAEKSLRQYSIDSGITQPLQVARVERVTTQVVSGTLTRIEFLVSGSPDSKTIRCHSEVWARPWLNSKEINVSCQNDSHLRGKKGLVGGLIDQDPTEPRYKALAEESLKKYAVDSGITESLAVSHVEKVTTQLVSGKLTRIKFLVSGSPDSKTIKCHSEIWERDWLNFKEIKVSCENDSHLRGKRQDLPGGISQVDPTAPQYKALAEESLRKYTIDYGIAEPLEVVQVERVTTQIVAGSLTRIDFLVSGSPNSKTIKCHSEVWEQGWRNFKEIKVSCLPINKRVKRYLRMPGGASEDNLITSQYKILAKESIRGNSSTKGQQHVGILRGHGEEEQDPNKTEYKILAEESLRKFYLKKSTVYHKVVEVHRVVTRVVSGIKYKIDFTAAPTACLVNVSNARARSCKADDDVLLYCHSDIWDQPWLKKKKIDIQCNGPTNDNDDFSEYESDNDLSLKPSDPQKNNTEKYIKLAEEASEKYLTTSNRKYIHKVTEILSASEQVADGNLTNIDYTLSPTTCLRNGTNTSCKLKQPLVVFNCNANIRIRQLHVEKEINVTCKKNSKTNGKKHKRESGVRNIREIDDADDGLDEDTTYYYADRAVQHINDRSNSNNLHKLISIHALQSSVQMGTLTVKMYIETAETFCLRHHKSKDLRNCEEMNGINHRLCLVRLWPSPDDELIVRHVSVVCDDEEDFVSVTGVNIPELIRLSVAYLESPPENKFKLVHNGEPQVIPSLDSRRPFKLNFLISVTNCSKDVNLDKNPFQCYLNPSIPKRKCHSYIWLRAEAKYIINIDAKCTPIATSRYKRSALEPENVVLDNLEIQKMVTAALEQLEMQSLHRYKQRVLQINSHSTKITSGKVTTIDFDVGYTSCLKYEWVEKITNCNFLDHLPRRRCVAQIWERLWIGNGKNIDVNCVDDETPLESHIEFESAEMANELAKQALKHIEAKYPHPSKQKVVRIFSLEKQVVAGIHYKMKIEVGFTDCLALSDQKDCKLVQKKHGLNKFCRVNVWIRPWTDHPPNFRVSCDFQEGTTRDLYHHVQAEHLFFNFLTTYSPSYVNNYTQMHKRFEIFKNNIKKIHELNVHEKGTAVYGVTRFTDLSYEEFRMTYMGLKTNLTNENQVPMKQADIPNIKVPPNFDWRDYDAVTDVKDQGSCGSCWAFSVTGNIEGQWKMQSGQLVSLSEQELVDCDKLDEGCNGGLPDNAYRAIEQMGGLELESDYPYEGTEDKCLFNKTLAKVQISSAVNITTNETGMAQWLVHNGPISIGINANAMQFYMGGISHPWKMLCNPTNLDHGVLIVGFGVKDYPLFHKQLPYWIIKNSWGKSWGEQGYYRVYRGDGTCGVNQMASSAVI